MVGPRVARTASGPEFALLHHIRKGVYVAVADCWAGEEKDSEGNFLSTSHTFGECARFGPLSALANPRARRPVLPGPTPHTH